MKMCCKMLAMIMAISTLLLCWAMPIQAAVAEPDIEPMWDNTASVTISLGFPDDGSAEATVFGKSGVTKIIIDVYVYRQSGNSWIYVAEKHVTINNRIGSISCQFTAISNTYYRADYTFTITRNGIDEIIQETKYRTCE